MAVEYSDVTTVGDLIEAAGLICNFLRGARRDNFASQEMLKSAICWQLCIIGEAITRLSPEFRAKNPQIDWKAIRGTRNFLAHRYELIDWSIIWATGTESVPELLRRLHDIKARTQP
jgi:uncharacterized protein with HEPN domain